VGVLIFLLDFVDINVAEFFCEYPSISMGVFTKKCSGEVVVNFNIKNDKKMAKESSKQRLANLIQSYEQAVKSAQSLYDDDDLKQWAIDHSLLCQDKIKDVKKKLKDTFSIDYDATDAKKKVIKEGSEVEVLVNHMDGMKGGTATIKSYSLPANISDITMKDGMKMKDHKWLTNDEVKLK